MKAKDLKKKLDKSHPRSIYVGEEIEGITVPRLPSGSFTFDLVSGGGIPKNRITVFHGPKSSSKTTFALRIAGMFQTLNPGLSAVFVDFEGTFDWSWARTFIPDRDRCIIVRPDYGEEGIDLAKAYASEAEDVGLIIIDSLAGILPTAEAEASAADYTQLGLQVRLVNRLIRVLVPHMSQASKRGRELTVLMINQIRANMNRSGPFGSAYQQPCGKFLEHAASMDVKFYQGEYTKVKGIPVKVKHRFMVDKNKVGVPKRDGELAFYLTAVNGYPAGAMEEDKVILTYAKRAGIVAREGNKWFVRIPGKRPVEADTLTALMDLMSSKPKLLHAMKQHTLKVCIENPHLAGIEEPE